MEEVKAKSGEAHVFLDAEEAGRVGNVVNDPRKLTFLNLHTDIKQIILKKLDLCSR